MRRIALRVLSDPQLPLDEIVRVQIDSETLSSNGRLYLLGLCCLANHPEAVAPVLGHLLPETRLAAAVALEQTGYPLTPEMARTLGTVDGQAKSFKQMIFGKLFDRQQLQSDSFAEGHPSEAEDALVTSLLTGDAKEVTEFHRLVQLAAHPEPGVAILAEQALRRLGKSAADALADTLPNLSPRALEVAFKLLGEWRDRRLIAFVETQFRKAQYNLPSSGIAALAAMGGDRAVYLLLNVMECVPPQRPKAAAAIVGLGWEYSETLSRAYLENAWFRRTHGELLAQAVGSRALALLLEGLRDPLRAVRDSAEAGMIRLGPAAVNTLCELLGDADREVRLRVLQALGRIGDKTAEPFVAQYLPKGNRAEQLAAIAALGPLWDHGTLNALAGACRSSDWRIREAAVLRIGDAATSDVPQALVLLDETLRDGVMKVRRASLIALYHLGPKAGIQLSGVTALIGRGAADLDPTVGQLAKEILDIFNQERVTDDGGVRLVRRIIRPHLDSAPKESRSDLEQWTDHFFGRVLHSHAWQASPPPAPPTDINSAVHFSVTFPRTVVRGQSFLVEVWAHLDRFIKGSSSPLDWRRRRDHLIQTVGPAYLASGRPLLVRLQVPAFGIADENTMLWIGLLSSCNFGLTIPDNASLGSSVGTATVMADELMVARISFIIFVGDQPQLVPEDQTSHQAIISSAFASYASEDRDQVLAIVQGMLKVMPDLDIFLDVVSLRSGDFWKEKLEDEIGKRDVFHLFWSVGARQSPWVDWEWRTALRTKGLECIEPVPLDSPAKAPPPPELAALHFEEWTRLLRTD